MTVTPVATPTTATNLLENPKRDDESRQLLLIIVHHCSLPFPHVKSKTAQLTSPCLNKNLYWHGRSWLSSIAMPPTLHAHYLITVPACNTKTANPSHFVCVVLTCDGVQLSAPCILNPVLLSCSPQVFPCVLQSLIRRHSGYTGLDAADCIRNLRWLVPDIARHVSQALPDLIC